MTVSVADVYEKFRVRANIQQHMYRVAAVTQMIADVLEEGGKMNSEEKHTLIAAAAVHDLLKIISLPPEKLKVFHDPADPISLQQRLAIRTMLIERYGPNEEKATLQVIQQLDLWEDVYALVQQLGEINNPQGFANWEDVFIHLREGTLLIKLLTYADWRVSPQGIVSLQERHTELRARLQDERWYNNLKLALLQWFEEELAGLLARNLSLEGITNETAVATVKALRNYVLLQNRESFEQIRDIVLEEAHLIS